MSAIARTPYTWLPDPLVAELSDAFDEAMTVTVGADGALTFGHRTGLANANRAMQLLPSRPFPPIVVTLEKQD